jgi:LemA protein
MKKTWIIIAVIVVLVIVLYSAFKGSYNSMVALDENVKTAWSNVQTQYQRRSDLIPNLVNTVKGFAEQEREVLVGVTEARARATSIQIDADNLDAAAIQKFQAAQGELSSALSRLLATVEAYPDLKSNQNFLELQAQLEGTENRIAVARDRYNASVQEYNTTIRSFPTNLMANMFGFELKAQFQASEAAQEVPEVSF